MSRDTSFYYSFLVLPAVKRDAIVAIWDFCRAVDDAVDEPGIADPQAALDAWRVEIDRCFEGAPETSQGRNLQPFIGEFGLPRRPFEDLVDGVEMDLRRSRYETFDALTRYCWRVASTVGLICLEIFGYTRPEARDYAVNLGIALQLTNIIRDVRIDLERGRVYLPQEDLRRFGVTEDDLRAGRVTGPVRELLAHRVRSRPRVLRAARGSCCRAKTRDRSSPPRSCAASTTECSSGSSARTTTCSAMSFACPAPGAPLIAAAIWARSLAGLRARS